MIVYDLICESQHRCEGWFDSPQDYQRQLTAGLLTCPVCGSGNVQKIPTASRVQIRNTSESSLKDNKPGATPDLMRRLRDFVEQNFDDVGHRFAEEAKRIHKGEAEGRNIRGQATAEEVAELQAEGIETLALPPDKEKLN